MKLNVKKIVIGVVAALAVAGGAVIVMSKSQPKGMTVAVTTLPDSLNPVLEQNTSGLNAVELIFDGLTNYEVDSDTGRLVTELALAESIEQNSDLKSYTVTLKEVDWHDSTSENPHVVTADDVVFSYKAYVSEENNSPKRSYILSFISDVVALDEKTVKVEFTKPIPPYSALPVLSFKIIPSKYNGLDMNVNMRSGDNERKFSTAPVGTGPFKLSSWEIGKWLTFDHNSLYFKGEAYMEADSLVIKETIDPVVRMNELSKGNINVILETNPMDRPKVSQIPNVDINSYLPFAFYEVEINTTKFPNAESRQAMAMSLDKPNLIPSITDQESGVVINNGPYPSNLFMAKIPDYVNEPLPNLLPYDLEKAKALASSSGISGKSAILIYPDSMGDFGKQMSEGIANQLKEIGLTVEVKRTGDQVFNRMVYKEKSYDLALMYREGFDDAFSGVDALYRANSEENVTGIADSKLNAMFDELDKVNETKDWAKKILEINKKVSELSPALYLCSLQKDVYSRGLYNVVMATDNPFLSVENWKFKK